MFPWLRKPLHRRFLSKSGTLWGRLEYQRVYKKGQPLVTHKDKKVTVDFARNI